MRGRGPITTGNISAVKRTPNEPYHEIAGQELWLSVPTLVCCFRPDAGSWPASPIPVLGRRQETFDACKKDLITPFV